MLRGNVSILKATTFKKAPGWYSALHDQLPPLEKKVYFASVLAKSPPTAWLQELRFWQTCDRPSSAVSWSLSNIVRFPPVRYCQIPSTSLQRQRCTRVLAATTGGVVKGERKKRTSSIWFSWPTKAILHGNQKGPCVQPQPFATTTTYKGVTRTGQTALPASMLAE